MRFIVAPPGDQTAARTVVGRFPVFTSTAYSPPRPRAIHETDVEIDAYNAAFDELGLDWHWDRSVMRELAAIPIESARIATYLQSHRPHLLKAYPADFLVTLILETKSRLRDSASVASAPAHGRN
jgi:hypothetical protein